jgi:hypothetical protein
MNVISSELSLASSHSYSRVETTAERLDVRGRGRAIPGNAEQDRRGSNTPTGPAAVVLSGEGRALAAAELVSAELGKPDSTAGAIESAAEKARSDPGNQLLIALVEYLTGKRITLVDSKGCHRNQCESGKAMESNAADQGRISSAARGRQSGVSVHYESTHTLQEREETQFTAEGEIRTADGKAIRFAVELSMQRSYREESHVEILMGPAAKREDPLVINFQGSSAQLQDQRFEFDLNGDGKSEALPLLASGSGFLVYDKNGDGEVNDGSELFGAFSGDGYADLKGIDDDGNGWIDAADSATEQLYLWLPEAGGDGKLLTLEEAGVAGISTSSIATPFELRGQQNADLGAVRSTGLYLSTDDTVGTTQQIDLTV